MNEVIQKLLDERGFVEILPRPPYDSCYQSRIDHIKKYGINVNCFTNDRVFIELSYHGKVEYGESFSLKIIGEIGSNRWTDIEAYSISERDVIDNLDVIICRLSRAWNAINEYTDTEIEEEMIINSLK